MIVNADLHVHSKYSGNTSSKMNLENISIAAPFKGINIMGTGDCLNNKWLEEIKKCKKIDDGTFQLNDTRFILTTEIEAEKRVHNLVFFPCISSLEAFKEKIKKKCDNLDIDGRPKINMTGEELAQTAKDVDALIGPAHAFTPYTSVYSAFNSLEECYGDMTDFISFVELGLSADSNLADKIKELHNFTFLTNSDSHSPHPVRLAREFTRFEVKDATYDELKDAILRQKGNKPILNIGLPPEEGKYHESACTKCYRHYTLEEAEYRSWKCGCGKKIKKGVKDRINEIANFKESDPPDHRPPYLRLIPMAEIITKALDQRNPFTQTVTKRWTELVSAFCSEIRVLLDVDFEYISKITVPTITESIKAFREKRVEIRPGGGGKYGVIMLPDKSEKMVTISVGPIDTQDNPYDY